MKLVLTAAEEKGIGSIMVALEKEVPASNNFRDFYTRKDQFDKAGACLFVKEGGIEINYNEDLMLDVCRVYVKLIPIVAPIVRKCIQIAEIVKTLIPDMDKIVKKLDREFEALNDRWK